MVVVCDNRWGGACGLESRCSLSLSQVLLVVVAGALAAGDGRDRRRRVVGGIVGGGGGAGDGCHGGAAFVLLFKSAHICSTEISMSRLRGGLLCASRRIIFICQCRHFRNYVCVWFVVDSSTYWL